MCHINGDMKGFQAVCYPSDLTTTHTTHIQILECRKMLCSESSHQCIHVTLIKVIPKNLHILEIHKSGFPEHDCHIIYPRQTSTRSMSEKRICIDTWLILDQNLEFLVLNRFGYLWTNTSSHTIELTLSRITIIEIVSKWSIIAMIVFNHIYRSLLFIKLLSVST